MFGKFVFAGALALAVNARADEFAGQFFIEQAAKAEHRVVNEPMRLTGAVPDMIARAAAASVGGHWAPALVRIARIESGLRCSPGGNGGGLFQFTRGTRAKIGLRAPLSCSANVNAAMRYAARCIAAGARTAGQLMACWNSGSPFTRVSRLEPAYRRALGRG